MLATLLLGGGCTKDQPAPQAPVSNVAPEPSSAPAPCANAGDAQASAARAERDSASRQKLEAEARLAIVECELDALREPEDRAHADLQTAQSQADRDAANARLADLSRQRAELEQRAREAKADVSKSERRTGGTFDPACLDNPLAKGCS